ATRLLNRRSAFGIRDRYSDRQWRVPDAALTFAASMRLTRRPRSPQRNFLRREKKILALLQK
ncbi:hypothetical protein, partial [Pectobacterium peruviense]|uniref:hypothetical protein n=1 Tax=Pectobacterium peruviense TaxID=2066479 RepID=UPI001CB8A88C